MNPEVTTLAFESWIKALNENGVKAEITTNVVIGDTHYAQFTYCPPKPIENITIDYEVIDGKINFKENK